MSGIHSPSKPLPFSRDLSPASNMGPGSPHPLTHSPSPPATDQEESEQPEGKLRAEGLGSLAGSWNKLFGVPDAEM